MTKFIGLEAALAMHQIQIDVFGAAHGLRDKSLLDSALAQAQTTYATAGDIHEAAAQYCISLAKNHPFLDGNKRIGADCMLTFLMLNGIEPTMDAAQLFDWTMRSAMNELDRPALAALLRQHTKSRRRSI